MVPIVLTGNNKKGFTLVEILVAIFIFSLLLSTVYGSLRFFLSSSDALGRGTVQFDMGRECLKRMVSDVEAIRVAVPPTYSRPEIGGDPDPYRVVGDSSYLSGNTFSRIRFTALSHCPFGEQSMDGVAEIVYYVSTLQDGDNVLRRADHLYPYEEFEESDRYPIVCRNIQGFSITYFDEEGEETDSWDSESSEYAFSTPVSMIIALELGDEDAPIEFSTRILVPVYREKQE